MMSQPQPLINAVYYPSWRVYRGSPPSILQTDCINRIYYAFARLKQDGTVIHLDEHADLEISVDGTRGCLSALAQLKAKSQQQNNNNNQIQTLISIGGGSGSAQFPHIASDASKRKHFVSCCRSFVAKHHLSGVDIDWEHPETPRDGANYLLLLQDLRAALPRSEGYILTTALPVGLYCLRNIDLAAASEVLDSLNLMGYDLYGSWTEESGHHAALFPPAPAGHDNHDPALSALQKEIKHRNSNAAVEYAVSHGFARGKILLGIPAYARIFHSATGPGDSFKSARETDFNELPSHWIQNANINRSVIAAAYVDDGSGGGLEKEKEEEDMVVEATEKVKGMMKKQTKQGTSFASFDVAETVGLKAEYVKRENLGGLFYWTGVGDIAQGPDSLVRAGWETLNGGA
ncbi:glycoside hydrolase family 18 protein [Xylariaceae sp. FL0255]|nr:glycoside hydrolase family 18 protein [Xylariaceae sp. FL0255]